MYKHLTLTLELFTKLKIAVIGLILMHIIQFLKKICASVLYKNFNTKFTSNLRAKAQK